jgi:hypothetical protein
MKSKTFYFLFSIAFSISSLPLLGQSTTIPNAPQPGQQPPPAPAHIEPPKEFSQTKWYGVIDPGEAALPLSGKDKMAFWLHEEVEPTSLIPAFVSAGYGQLKDSDPRFGSDSGAFGERLGAAALRQASFRFFSDSLFPLITDEDPRYFRMGSGSPVARGTYAIERLVIDHKNSGIRGINFSDTAGRLVASSLTMTYYPAVSANAGVVFKTWGVSMVGGAANNLFLEFWPDIRDAVFHRKKH